MEIAGSSGSRTAFYDFALDNGYIKVDDLVGESGYQKCVINYPNLSGEEIFETLEKFYRSYYLRPSYIFKAVKKMARDPEERKRMWQEGKDFFRSMRKRREMNTAADTASSPAA